MHERQKYCATGSTESQEMYLATIYKVYKNAGAHISVP